MNASENNNTIKNQEAYEGIREAMLQEGVIPKEAINYSEAMQDKKRLKELKGIVTMDIDGWGDAGGHTTLWNGSKFLDDTNYLNDEKDYVFVRELCFWELL